MLSLSVKVNTSPFDLLVVDSKGEIHYANPFSEKTLNLNTRYKKPIQKVFPGSNIIKAIKEGHWVLTYRTFLAWSTSISVDCRFHFSL